jgi:hypothetical protein
MEVHQELLHGLLVFKSIKILRESKIDLPISARNRNVYKFVHNQILEFSQF